MNNFIDTVFNTAATDNKIKYKIIHADSTEEVVELQMYTPVTTTGTAMNKTFFDSIKDDLNSRLLTSNKASQAEAETGTNDTKYMTPLKTQQKFNSLVKSYSKTSVTWATTDTITDFTEYANNIVTIQGGVTYANATRPSITIEGSNINGASHQDYVFSTVVGAFQPFIFRIDLKSKTGVVMWLTSNGWKNDYFTFNSLSSFKIQIPKYGSYECTVEAAF